MTASSKPGVSVLDGLVGDIMATKTDKAPKRGLTALPGEVVVSTSPIPNHPVVGTLPDDPDMILARLASAKREVQGILEAIHRLEQAWGKPEEVLEGEREQSQKAIEREADRRAADREKAEAGDKRAAARVEAEQPIEVVAEAEEARLAKKAAVLAAMTGEAPETADFAENFARLQAEAQAAVYGDGVADSTTEGGEDPEPAPTAAGWTCPIHKTAVVKRSPRRNREYRGCPEEGCPEFERL